MKGNFADRLIILIRRRNSILICGLDPQLKYFPPFLLQEAGKRIQADESQLDATEWAIATFNKGIIQAVSDHVAGFKPQRAFYEKYSFRGIRSFEETVRACFAADELMIIIEDAKRLDGGDTAQAYADGHLGMIGCDNF